MKTLAFTTTLALVAPPALAHGDAHIHPHSGEILLVLSILAAIGAVAQRLLKK